MRAFSVEASACGVNLSDVEFNEKIWSIGPNNRTFVNHFVVSDTDKCKTNEQRRPYRDIKQ